MFHIIYLNKIDNGLSNNPKCLLLKYVSLNFGSAISDSSFNQKLLNLYLEYTAVIFYAWLLV